MFLLPNAPVRSHMLAGSLARFFLLLSHEIHHSEWYEEIRKEKEENQRYPPRKRSPPNSNAHR